MVGLNSKLARPFRLAGVDLRNRLARSATAERLAGPDGVPDGRQEQMYRELAAGGVGLIITGHGFVHAGGQCHPEMTGIHHDGLIQPLARLAKVAHEGGAKIAVQINHGGRACDPEVVPDPVAPSAIPLSKKRTAPRELTEGAIGEIVGSFGEAARRARAAGFDAVQIHGAHGYLVSQFLSPRSNQREDRYGGILENRARFLHQVAESVRSAVGPEYPVLVKLGITDNMEGGLTVDEGAEVASWLGDFGIDGVEVSTGLRGAVVSDIESPDGEAYLLPLARAVRKRTDLPLLLVGGMRSLTVMERVLDEGVDIVSLSRPLIREPDLPEKLRTGRTDRAACESCSQCWPKGLGDGISCKKITLDDEAATTRS